MRFQRLHEVLQMMELAPGKRHGPVGRLTGRINAPR
ncbi:hypothetical protein AWB68_05277 [Caballeronia choica]|uniref:Uncharacterized protein n=1 Tax=Caballeronia choica TaxID=326476 RepID=A0A158K9T9_9BURK|nr:hypothetical protein AWB68_05277 [Caballeronia choica]